MMDEIGMMKTAFFFNCNSWHLDSTQKERDKNIYECRKPVERNKQMQIDPLYLSSYMI